MIEIQSTCTSCGTVLNLAPAELLLLLPADADGGPDRDSVHEARLVHECVACGRTTVREVDRRMAALLEAERVPTLPDLELEPAVLPHPETPPPGAAWSADDVIELHDLLESADWFEHMLHPSDGTP